MVIIPAIDLLDGRCVRLLRGDYAESTEYEHDPVELARRFEEMGVRRIHLVDLNAARGDGSNNREVIAAVRKAVSVTVEVGGGIRGDRDVEELMKAGVDRLIVGTLLIRNPDTVAGWAAKYPNTFIAGIDARDGEVRISGWEEGSAMSDTEAARLAKEVGAVSIVYTNIERDGTLQGPDIENSLMAADASGLPVIISGGIRKNGDFQDIEKMSNRRIAGAITGKALYEGKINLPELAAVYSRDEFEVW
jgi:phosphoribosylformimino-5-aminoimidazole carboxamide ribotide isomerase